MIMPLPYWLLPLYMTTDNFCEKLGSLLKKFLLLYNAHFCPCWGGTGRKFLCSKVLPLSNGQIEAFCLTIATKKSKKEAPVCMTGAFRKLLLFGCVRVIFIGFLR